MDFSNIHFNRDCFVELHTDGYGALSGLFFTGKDDLLTLERLFKDSHDWQPAFKREGRQYVKGFVAPGNVQFIEFMQNSLLEEKSKLKVSV